MPLDKGTFTILSMIIDTMAEDDQNFTDTFGRALDEFLKLQGLSESEASKTMDMPRGTLNTYTSGVNGRRHRPPAELLARACLLGFKFPV
jgi:hypothetical protein